MDLFLRYVDILHDLFSRQIITGERKAQHGKKACEEKTRTEKECVVGRQEKMG